MRKLFNTLLGIFTFGKGIKRKISGFELRIPVGFHNYFEPDYELNNINFINNYISPGMKVIDIGAHIGLLSVVIARKTGSNGKVYSFEPTPSTHALLKQTIAINGLEAVIQPQTQAVADKKGVTHFYVTDIAAHNSNSLANNKRNYGNEHSIEVPLISVDEFVQEQAIDKIDFIKIDAEGAEFSVLKGLVQTIDRYKPKMILALHPASIANFGDSLGAIWDFVRQRGYKVIYRSDEVDRDFFVRQDDLFDVFLL
jgi:FkbM family methyltransferase